MALFFGAIAIALATPLFALLGAGIRALILFWPVMLLVGALSHVPGFEWVPAIGWWESMLIVGILGLLIPGGPVKSPSSASSD